MKTLFTLIAVLSCMNLFASRKDTFNFNIGKQGEEYHLTLIVDKVSKGNIIYSDTLLNAKKMSGKNPIKLIGINNKNKREVEVSFAYLQSSIANTYNYELKRSDNFYIFKGFGEKEFQRNAKTPLFVFSSSWWDGKYERNCGPDILTDNHKNTTDYLKNSSEYFLISYLIK